MELKNLVTRKSGIFNNKQNQNQNQRQSNRHNMRFTLVGLIAVTLLLTFSNVDQSEGYSGGAPTSTSICTSMTPGHSGEPKTSPSPYVITVDKTTVAGGETVQVTLASQEPSGRPFKGFLALGRKENYKTEKGLHGKFLSEVQSSSSSPSFARISSCSEISQSSATHNDAREKRKVSLNWQAPNEDGKFVVVATFVEDYSNFWVEQPSQVITVKRSANFQENTTPKAPRATASPEVQERLKTVYEGCGDSDHALAKGCFGLPSGCVQGGQNCDMLVTYRPDGQNGFRFELIGREDTPASNSYVAFGLSKDSSMGDDTVFGCRKDGNSIIVGEYYNTPQKVAEGVTRSGIIVNQQGEYVDGYLSCSFNVKPPSNIVDVPDKTSTFDLANDRFNVLLARGTNSAKDYLGKHPNVKDRDVAPQAVKLSDVNILESKSPILVELHGAFMIMAWLLCASSGMFTARYYKQTHTTSKPCGVAFWFAFHRFCMALTILLSLTASVLIFVANDWTYTHNPTGATAETYHPILGIILTCLAVLQVLIAFCRPSPTARSRWAFNWFHWTVGNAAHIIGIACIFLANDLSKSNLQGQSRYWGVLTGFVVFHICLHILMSFHTLKADKKMEIQNKKRAVLPGPMKLSGLDAEAPGTGFRTAILTVYILGAAVTASLLVYFVVDSLENTSAEL